MRTLDFNTIERHTMRLVMQDEAKTAYTVVTPTEGLVEELEAMSPHLAGLSKGNAESTRLAYELAAKLISCNLEGKLVTANELRGPYKWGLDHLIIFYYSYWEFIDEIGKQKN